MARRERDWDKDYDDRPAEELPGQGDNTQRGEAAPKKESRRKRRQRMRAERAERDMQLWMEREREAIRAEILAEMEAARQAEGTPDPIPTAQEAPAKVRKPSRATRGFWSVISGNILSGKGAKSAYPYLLLLLILSIAFIADTFGMQRMYYRRDKLATEVRELRIVSLSVASQKMKVTRQSDITRQIERRGLRLKESLEPNKVIVDREPR